MDVVRALIGDECPIEIPLRFERYEYIEMLGAGSFSVVIKVRHRSSDAIFACKVCSRDFLLKNDMFDFFEREVRVQQGLRHPNLVQLLDVVYHTDLIFLIMEYCPNADLCQLIADRGRLEECEVRRIFAQLVDAMAYLHGRSIAHRDLKPNNILLDEFFNPKISDFGLCHQTDDKKLLKTPCGSVLYAAPEILSEREYDGQLADVWSLGVVLYSMLTSSLPWASSNQTQIINQICSGEFYLSPILSTETHYLVTKMMSVGPASRPTMAQISKHPWGYDELLASGQNAHQPTLLALAEESRRSNSDRRLHGGIKRMVNVRPPGMSFAGKTIGSLVPGPASLPSETWGILKRSPSQTVQLKPIFRQKSSASLRPGHPLTCQMSFGVDHRSMEVIEEVG
jgi:serine/threonine protein kinase